jgi:hypothetical protein
MQATRRDSGEIPQARFAKPGVIDAPRALSGPRGKTAWTFPKTWNTLSLMNEAGTLHMQRSFGWKI